MRRVYLCLALLLVYVIPSACGAATYLVKPDGTGDFPTIQAAVIAAAQFDVIELADGTFTGNGNRDVDYLEKPITIRSQGGDPDSCIIDCNGAVWDQHRGFYVFAVGSSAVLEGVTVRDGWEQYGGAVRLDEADLTIRNCIFENCWAQEDGGAVYAHLAAPDLDDCRFRDNATAGYGGAIYFEGTASPSVVSCDFRENEATRSGGALHVGPDVNPYIRDSRFEQNVAGYNGGGISCYQSEDVYVNDCTFLLNQADNKGGGFYSGNGAYNQVEDCTFDTNFAGLEGGGLTCVSGAVAIDECLLSSNTSGVYGGAVSFDTIPDMARIWWSTFENNHSTRGGAIALHRHSQYQLEIVECILSENSCEVAGGAICAIDEASYEVWIQVYDSTLYQNSGQHGSHIYASRDVRLTMANTIVAFGVDGAAVFCEAGQPFVALDVDCCDVFGNEGGDWVGCLYGLGQNGNISMDPMLCDPEEGDFHLLGDSPCAPGSPPNPECDLIGAMPVGCVPLDVPDLAEVTTGVGLTECRPNPFSGKTTIAFRLPASGPVKLTVYDVCGREVRVLLSGGYQERGERFVAWDGKSDGGKTLAPGVYYYQFQTDEYSETRPVILMR